jgi:hypothetical protein
MQVAAQAATFFICLPAKTGRNMDTNISKYISITSNLLQMNLISD